MELLKVRAVKEFLKRVGGEKALAVVEICAQKNPGITDEEIAQELGEKVTTVRAVLNKLHYWGVMDYSKRRDEHTGWFTYLWKIDWDHLAEIVRNDLLQRKEQLEERLKLMEEYMLFRCEKCGTELVFEVAAEYSFKCPECGSNLNPVNGERERRKLRKELAKISEELIKLDEAASRIY